ncbi:uncharacterized protein LAESUDRAFT_760987 [Laetiporus sulphureus 93-53]|uniref:DASH complex subunit DAD2 n=1 Tax=Laetiporus sulphureus 93-53 TaxID=1314785 RepID=A0A165DEE8_9APHY|nr:uncharacterized protein LAESUDRAFT_760987 [Laetiporus sulphureus 93-53]KZT04701.1 hypothetical protein LAESUDRAFT_760987 [Laetiporus sulphureus 93-53]
MRQSSARQSQISSGSTNVSLSQALLEKKKEYEAVAALERASSQFLKRMEEIGDDFDVMAEAGRVHGQVLDQWPNMFRILSLFLSTRERQSEEDDSPSLLAGERLVRVPVEELRSTEDKS